MYLQSLLRGGHCSPVGSVLKRHQRRTVPTAGDLREEPVFDGIELGTIRRIMNNKKSDTQFVGKVHKILLDDSVRAGVRTSTIAQDNEGARAGILLLQMLFPDSGNVVTDKLGCVMTDSQRHIAYIFGHIIDAVWDNLTVGEGGEVVIKGLKRSVGQSLSLPLEVPEHLLLPGVNADNGQSHARRLLTNGSDLLELFVPVLDILHGKVLVERAFPKAKGIKDLMNKVARDNVSDRGELTHDLCDTQGYPYHILILRETRCVRFDDLHDSLCPFRMLGKHTLASSSRSADAAITRTFSRKKFPDTFFEEYVC